jgi:hypothetical protein
LKTLEKDKDSSHVPQAYPQIANALEILASNIPAEINLPVEKGYALATDKLLAIAGIICCALAVIGALTYIVSDALNNNTLARIGAWIAAFETICGSIIGLYEFGKMIRR